MNENTENWLRSKKTELRKRIGKLGLKLVECTNDASIWKKGQGGIRKHYYGAALLSIQATRKQLKVLESELKSIEEKVNQLKEQK